MNYILIISVLLFISICANIILSSNSFRYYLENIGKKKNPAGKEYIKNKKQEYTHYILKKMLKKFIKIANKHNIKYWATAGTLLGAIRHENIIPWDDDIDLGITPESLQKIKQLEQEFTDEGIIIVYDNITQLRFKENNIHIDLFEYGIKKDKYIMTNKWCRESFPKEYYFENEIKTLKKTKLDDIVIDIPSEPFLFLRRAFGDWEIPKNPGSHSDTAIKESDYKNFDILK